MNTQLQLHTHPHMRRLALCVVMMLLSLVMTQMSAAETMTGDVQAIATFTADDMRAGQVEVRVSLQRSSADSAYAEILVEFVPVGSPFEHYHLYSTDLSKTGIDGVGRPTLAEVPTGALYAATAALVITKDIANPDEALQIYTDGAVLARLPIHLPAGDGTPLGVQLLVTYMSCTQTSCNRPVTDRLLEITLPSHPQGYQRGQAVSVVEETTPLVSTEPINPAPAQHDDRTINWTHVASVAELEAYLASAQAAQTSISLHFTGPSCAVCQTMKKTVFYDKRVIAGWNNFQAIEIDTDASLALALWQQEHYNTQARPLYVRIDYSAAAQAHSIEETVDTAPSPESTSTSLSTSPTVTTWSQVFDRDDEHTMTAFISFLNGGVGMNQGTGEGLLQFLLLAIGGGLFTLLMPCTYPMIPLTVNFFNKQAVDGRSIVPLACAYALGIVLFFTFIGVFIVFVLQSAIATFAGNPWTNLVIALLFLFMGLSLLDMFFLRLPHGLTQYFGAGSSVGGYLGALLMGCTFAVTAFTCTAPFAGAVLAEGLRSGSLIRPVVGMAVYASAIAIPFFILSLSPKLLKGIPNAGSWMSEIKHVGGVVEIAAAIKFIVICDVAWGWGVFNRSLTLSLWTLASLAIALYIAGYIRLAGDSKIHKASIWRILIAITWAVGALWFLSGLLGLQNLGVVESFFPNDTAPNM